jgi:hypothetical protein
MSENAKHTPTPWVIGNQLNDHGLVIRGGRGAYVARIGENLRERDANAAFIVRAVNNHSELLYWAKLFERTLLFYIDADRDDEGKKLKTVTLNMLREALKLAEAIS